MKTQVLKHLNDGGLKIIEGVRVGESAKHALEFVVSEGAEQFAAQAKSLGASLIFVESDHLEEHEFFFEESDADDPDTDEPFVITDLRDVEPGLKKFERFIGECRSLTLTISVGAVIISCNQFAEWYDDFEAILSGAVDKASKAAADADIARMQADEERQHETITAIHALRNDEELRSIALASKTSQTTFTSFVRMRVPEAARLPVSVLKVETTLLRDAIITSSRRK